MKYLVPRPWDPKWKDDTNSKIILQHQIQKQATGERTARQEACLCQGKMNHQQK